MTHVIFEMRDRDPRMPTRLERIGYMVGDVAGLVADAVGAGIQRIDEATEAAGMRRERDTQLLARFALLSPQEQDARFALDSPDTDLLEMPRPNDHSVVSIFSAPARGHLETGRTLQEQAARERREYCRRRQT